ncbi:aromatic prenyltransferase [Thozetella sp. PMI_491]|nr:aromatic prenyltransferase [Thozetella sp. PMI_491]
MGPTIHANSIPITLTQTIDTLILPPADPVHRWWWDRCAPLMVGLLQSSEAYTPEQQADHMHVFRDAVVPTFGPPTAEAGVIPLLTLDGSPFEPSWNFTNKGSVVRYTFEPLGPRAGTPSDPFAEEIVPSLIPMLERVSSDVDLRWFKQIMDQWFIQGDSSLVKAAKEALPPHVKRIPQIFVAFDMKAEKRMMKAYLFPVLKHLATGETTENLTFDMIRGLQPGGNQLKAAADKLQKYLATSKVRCPVEMVAIDCIDPSKARVKVYARANANSKAVLRDACTLGGTQTDEMSMKGLEMAEKVWHLLLDERGGMAEDQNKAPRNSQTIHKGVCFVFELKQGVERVDIKAHIPWCQTSASDLHTIANFTNALGALGWHDSASKYAKGTMETATLQKGAYMSSYFSPMVQEQ